MQITEVGGTEGEGEGEGGGESGREREREGREERQKRLKGAKRIWNNTFHFCLDIFSHF